MAKIAVGCREVLETLDRTLEKYQELSPNHKDSKPKDKIRRVWKRLNWEPDDIIALRNRITFNISLLHTFNGQITR